MSVRNKLPPPPQQQGASSPPRSRDLLLDPSHDGVGVGTEDNNNNDDDEGKDKLQTRSPSSKYCSGKTVVAITMTLIMSMLFWDAFVTAPEDRWLKPDISEKFLQWVQLHPYWGLGAFLVAIASCVVFMIPIGTPLTLGTGYIYKGVYGWTLGIFVGSIVSVAGSALGAVACFLLGRYLMRDRVRKWIRKYPLFDAIDVAVSEQGLRIMAMLYLTPVLPLGPVSYMCGTTGMALSSFALAKIASLPLMTLYVFIGASTSTLLSDPNGSEAKQIEENKTLIVLGMLLSAVMITGISRYIRKELDKILERQKKGGFGKDGTTPIRSDTNSSNTTTDEVIELGMAKARHRWRSTTTTTASDGNKKEIKVDVLERH